jgi:hypothetical protein
MRTRFARNKKREIGPWPGGSNSPEEVAARVSYIGSSEHKNHPSRGGPPALRSDATPCEPERTKNIDANTAALREGIVRRCTSAVFEGGFPRYVWTWIDGALYEARHINGPQGTYKGYRLERAEYPLDREGRLNWGGP